MAIASLCVPLRERRDSLVSIAFCSVSKAPHHRPSLAPPFLPSLLPFSSLLFSSYTHVGLGPLTFLTSSSFPVTPAPSFARHRVRFRLLFFSCFVFPAFCFSLGPHALSVVSFVSEVLKVCVCFVPPPPSFKRNWGRFWFSIVLKIWFVFVLLFSFFLLLCFQPFRVVALCVNRVRKEGEERKGKGRTDCCVWELRLRIFFCELVSLIFRSFDLFLELGR